MFSVPLIVMIVGAITWLNSGRVISTENALLKHPRLLISANISGPAKEVFVHDNQLVKKGETLFTIDSAPFVYELNRATAALSQARIQISEMRANLARAEAELEILKRDVKYYETEVARLRSLVKKGLASETTLDTMMRNLNKATAQQNAANKVRLAVLSGLGGDAAIETEQHPIVLSAKAQQDQAQYALNQTVVVAPANGIIYKADSLAAGQRITTGTPLFSLVSTEDVWVDANFKETELTNMHAGQDAKIIFDAFPNNPLNGKVKAIGAGTGSEFSLLPAQNATGNWVKVTQRVPVQISISDFPSDLALRAGMSATVSVDTQVSRSLSDLF